MKKYLFSSLVALIIGLFLSFLFLNQYKDYNGIVVSNNIDNLYFIQYGVFSSEESMEENTIELQNYVYNIENDLYYVYVGITKDKENTNKIINYYNSLGYEVLLKEYSISNKNFLLELQKYDEVLKSASDSVAISSIINQVLMKYEEVVINGA